MSQKVLDFTRLNIMGVINMTPDSFSDGGQFIQLGKALDQAKKLIDEGADILDIGGESTRPGAAAVSTNEELARTMPLIDAIRQFSDIAISIDTSKPEVMLAAGEAGADMINDVWALRTPGALQAATTTGLPVCLMHMLGKPGTMQHNPVYENVVLEVMRFLADRAELAIQAGIDRKKLVIDPGFGFGKNLQHNLQLLKCLSEFKTLGFPLLVGWSRKSMLGEIVDKPVEQRLYASLSAAVISAIFGANIIRVHDVAETYDALAIIRALQQSA